MYLSRGEGKSVTIKVHTSSVELYSILFSCSMRAIYNRVHHAQN